MRCLSPHAGYSIQVFEGEEQVMVDSRRGYANTVVIRKPVIADFQQGGLLEHEITDALTYFNFSGLPEGVNPLTRVSFFDTEAYAQRIPEENREQELAAIDQRLRELQQMFPSEFIIVDHPAAPKPWPSYDRDTVEEILQIQERQGYDPQVVRVYEQENQAREEIIAPMERLERIAAGLPVDDEPDTDEVVVSA